MIRFAATLPLILALAAGPANAQNPAWTWDSSDPRIGLRAGDDDAGEAGRHIERVAHLPKPEGFAPSPNSRDNVSNTDLAFTGNLVFVGSYRGFHVYDISDPRHPQHKLSIVCPGGQGDVSIHGSLLFMSVEETRGRIDCGIQGVQASVSPERFRGIRIFDFSDLDAPHQVAAVQTCRGSHTHSLASDPDDPGAIYVYVSGTGPVRSADELAGCSDREPDEDPNTSYFRIEVIRVPLDAPHEARVVSEPRIFADERGNIAGLWPGGDHGAGTQQTSATNRCHDITAYGAIGLAGGACSGNGILLDISDVAHPVRIDEVVDPNFAYWHSATFNNDGTKVVFTDEWGGGRAPRCRATDLPTWGANAIFRLQNRKLTLAGYYKLPVPQTETENCVAHNGSIVPVPGRDIMVQAWYQGGLSVFDFTDPEHPFEIAYFDRGPISDTETVLGGFWSTYWYNGFVYGAEIVRGLDVFELTPSEHLSQNEIDAARAVVYATFNPQNQPQVTWPASPTVARAYRDQLVRAGAISDATASALEDAIASGTTETLDALAARLEIDALTALAGGRASHVDRVRALLAETLRELAHSRH
jgi:hypothetical protein